MAELKNLKGIDEKDRKMLEDAEKLLGPEPATMGFIKNLVWGRIRQELVFPYPQPPADEKARCDAILSRLDPYLTNEHPASIIDQEQEIPDWVIKKLFELGVLGMTIPAEFGGGGLGITSYNRVLERIGQTCGSTAVLVSAHQSIGCKALMLFGTEDQKKRWLPRLANDWVSAFCLSEPNVGCDAGGQETRCELSEDGQYYILNGEKKWSTSAAISSLLTVMCKQKISDPATGKVSERVTALVCTPDMPGIEIFEKNRTKCGIRGTWQARLRFTNVKVPRDHLLHKEGKGLNVALSCLNYGRCTLSAGMLGGARTAYEQATKWAQTRYQFGRPLADFELIREKIARMSAWMYAMESMLYMTTGMLDRHDEDIPVETAVCKVFCSEMGMRCVDDAVQIMAGEGYMTENDVERIFRDSRINSIVEGANEVMRAYIFGYGGKQLAEKLLGVQEAVGWDTEAGPVPNAMRAVKRLFKPGVAKAAVGIGGEVFLGMRRKAPDFNGAITSVLQPHATRLGKLIQQHSHAFVIASKHYGEKIVSRQAVQGRLADSIIFIHAYACTLSRLDQQIRNAESGDKFESERAAANYFMDMAEQQVHDSLYRVFNHKDESMETAAAAALKYMDTQPNSKYYIHESSPNAKGTGRKPRTQGLKQFPGEKNPSNNG